MYFCYVDESGGFEAPSSTKSATPVMTFAGLIVDASIVPVVTRELLAAKERYYPGRTDHPLDGVLREVKGKDLRVALRANSRNRRRHATGFMDRVARILHDCDVRLVGRVWVKERDVGLNPRSSYTYALQDICRHFDHFLAEQQDEGIVVCDSRAPKQNEVVAHSVFTLKHKAGGDALPQVLESPLFGSSSNHPGLQLADLVASVLLFPAACLVYCLGQAPGKHANPRLERVRQRYGPLVQKMEYRYLDPADGARWRGGIVVSDRLGRRPSRALFEVP